jgi:hypothetical protein
MQGLGQGLSYVKNSRVGNESMPRSITSEGKRMRHVRAVDRHHFVKGALTGVG